MKKKSSFYVHFSPIYHSLLHESRIGDGHPVMLQYVMNGKRIGPIGNINLYSDEVFRSPCNSLLHSGKKIIVIEKNVYTYSDKLINCLNLDKSSFKKVNIDSLRKYDIYIHI